MAGNVSHIQKVSLGFEMYSNILSSSKNYNNYDKLIMYNFNNNKANANYVIVLGSEEQDSCNNPFFITV